MFIKNVDFAKLMLGIIILFYLLFCLFGCKTEQKAMKQLDGIMIKYPVPASQKFRAIYPCIKIGRSFYTDSTAYQSSLDSLAETKRFYGALIESIEPTQYIHDTITDKLCSEYVKEIERYKKIVNTQTKYIIDLTDDFNNVQPVVVHDSVTVRDTSIDMEKQKEIDKLKSEVDKVNQDRDRLNKKVDSKNKQLKWLYIILGLIAAYFGIKFYLKKYTKLLPL